MVGGGIKILGSAAIALHGVQLGVARIHHGAAQAQQLREHPLHGIGIGSFDFETQVGRFAVGAADAELLHFKAAAVLHYAVEDLLHDVRVNQMTLRFHTFLQRERRHGRAHNPRGLTL